jgi:hypothetical protein
MALIDKIPVRASHDWPSIPARKIDRWIVGADLGQTNDSTAVAVIHHTVTPLENWTPNAVAKRWRQDKRQLFDLLHLQRFPLGLSYVTQMQMVAELLQREPLASVKLDLVFDQTGVGAAVCDLADAIGLRHYRVVITAGLETTQADGRTWHVPKGVLISKLESAMHTRELQVADDLAEKEAFRAELQEFQRHVSATGRPTFGARGSSHDDIVLACAIAIWWATSRPTGSVTELRL